MIKLKDGDKVVAGRNNRLLAEMIGESTMTDYFRKISDWSIHDRARLRGRDFTMVVTMSLMLMMQVTVNQIVNMITMGHCGMSATRAMLMVGWMGRAFMTA